MESERPDFDEQDSGVPVTVPDREPDPLVPRNAPPAGIDAGKVGEGAGPAEHVRDQRAGTAEEHEGPAVPGRESGLEESNPAQGA
jgi:hypothetical protein